MSKYREIADRMAKQPRPGATSTVTPPSKYGKVLKDIFNRIDPGTEIYNRGHAFEEGYLPQDFAYDNSELGDAKEVQAQLQTGGQKLLNGLGRLGVKTGTEFMKGIGYLGGAIPAALTGDIEQMTNNFWVDAFQGLEDGSKEAMPVYTRKAIAEGNLTTHIFSPEFWANEGADGIGFLLSAIATGGVASAITKSTGIAAKIAKLAGKGAKTAGIIDNTIIAGAQTFVESAAETKGIVDDLRREWEHKFVEGKGYESNEMDENGEPIYLQQEEVDAMIGSAGAQTMLMNGILLMGPNMIQSKYLFGKGSGKSTLFDTFRKSSNNNLDEMSKALSKVSPWKTGSKEALKHGSISAGAEAWQELSQFGIENYQSKKGKGLTDAGWVEGLLDGYTEGLTTVEGHKSMFLGAVLGLGPGAAKAYKDSKAQLSRATKLTKLLGTNTAAFKEALTNIYKKDAEGNFVKDAKGKLQLDEKEFTKVMDSTSEDLMISKMYQQAKISGDMTAMKYALNELAIRHIYDYLSEDGGLEIWEKQATELMGMMENDAVDLGFSTGKEYAQYLKTIATQAKKEYNKVKEYGPEFYGIGISHLVKDKESRKDLKGKVAQFKERLNYNAVRLATIDNSFKKELSKVKKYVAELEESVTVAENETFEQAIAKDGITRIKHIMAKKQQRELEKAIEKVGKDYESIYDETAQQVAFDNMIKQQTKTEDAVEKDEVQAEVDKEEATEFYKSLTEKGYNVEPSKDGVLNDIGSNKVTLKHKDGTLFRIEREKNNETKYGGYIVRNLETNAIYPATMASLRKLGLNKKENILSREEFQKEVKTRNVLKRNNQRLTELTKLIGQHNRRYGRQYKNIDETVKSLRKDIAKYQEEIVIWQQPDESLSVKDVALEIEKLEAKINEINHEINTLKENKVQFERTLLTLRQLKTELTEVMKTPAKEFSFHIRLKELEKQLVEGKFDKDIVNVEDSIEVIEEILEELLDVKMAMSDALEDMYQTIIHLDEIESIVQDNTKKFSNIKKKLAKKYLGKDISTVTTEHVKQLLSNPESRREILNAIREDKKALMSEYNIKTTDMANLRAQMKNLNRELNKFKENKTLLIKYDKLALNLTTLEKRNEVVLAKQAIRELEIIQNKTSPTASKEQQDIDATSESLYKPVTKHTPFSTVTAVYEFDHITGKIKEDNGRQGRTVNYKQAVRWSRAMAEINLNNLDEYSLRFVNNQGLRDLDIVPPSHNDNDVYTVLYHQGEPYIVDSQKVFTGIAQPSTYFGKDVARINLSRNVTYLNAVSIDKKSTDFKFTHNGSVYTSLVDLENQLMSEMKAEYESWKADIESQLLKGNELYVDIKDVSRGIPSIDTNVRNSVKEVFGKIKKLSISHKDNTLKTNGAVMDTVPGMVYAESENGQLHRVFNKRIDSLTEKEQDVYINKILKFMALAYHSEGGKLKQRFKFTGDKVTETIPIVGHNGKMGIMDYFINWGETNKDWSIFIGKYNGKMAIRFVHEGGKPEFINLEDLFDGKGFNSNNVRKNGDESLITLTDFLKTKFLNVSELATNGKRKGKSKAGKVYDKYIKFPSSWSKPRDGAPQISWQKIENYNDFVLENYLYTNIEKYDASKDEIPNFVNNYAEFDRENIGAKPNEVKEEPKEAPTDNAATVASQPDVSPVFSGDNLDVANIKNVFANIIPNEKSNANPSNTNPSNADILFEISKLGIKPEQKQEDETKCKTKGKPPGAKKSNFNKLNPE